MRHFRHDATLGGFLRPVEWVHNPPQIDTKPIRASQEGFVCHDSARAAEQPPILPSNLCFIASL